MVSRTRSTLLFLHPGALGDTLLALSALRGLRERFRFSRCVFVGGRQIGRLLQWCGEVDEAISMDGSFLTNSFLPEKPRDCRAKEVLDSVSHAVCWMEDAGHTLARMLEQTGIPWIKIQSPHGNELQSLHQEDRFLEILADWGVRRPAWRPLRLPSIASIDHRDGLCKRSNRRVTGANVGEQNHTEVPAPVVREQQAVPDDIPGENVQASPFLHVIIHPGSGSPHKCLAPGIWANVIRRLVREVPRIEVILLGGPADSNALGCLRRDLTGIPIRVFENLDLISVATLLAAADLFMGHDSGITHLAAAVGTPTLAVFGPTSPARWAPRGSHVTVVQGAVCQCGTWDEVRTCREKPCLSVDPEWILSRVKHCFGKRSCDARADAGIRGTTSL